MKKPNVFIVGAPKCGTTSMAYYLDQHPDFLLGKLKEPHYFNFDSGHRFTYTNEEYLKNFNVSNHNHQYLIDSSVWYLYSEVAVKEIVRFNPDAKFIVMLRDPTDMFYSLHQQLLFSGKESIESPIEAWNAQEDRRNGKKIPNSCYDPTHLYYKEVCSLGWQIERMLKTVEKNMVLFITLDELKEDPDRTYLRVLRFLHAAPISLKTYKRYNIRMERKSYWLARLLKRINIMKQRLNFRKGVGLANFLTKKNRKVATNKYKSEFMKYKTKISSQFYDDILLIEKLTTLNLNTWK